MIQYIKWNLFDNSDLLVVHLWSPESKPAFKGFFVVARNEAGSSLGTWKSPDGHEVSCSAITHNNNNDKRNVVLTWKPPKNATSGKIDVM